MSPWTVVQVQILGPTQLGIVFHDGTEGLVNVQPSFMRGVFAPLRDPAFFRRATIEHGAVTWPGELDLAPDAMHRAIREKGEWVVA